MSNPTERFEIERDLFSIPVAVRPDIGCHTTATETGGIPNSYAEASAARLSKKRARTIDEANAHDLLVASPPDEPTRNGNAGSPPETGSDVVEIALNTPEPKRRLLRAKNSEPVALSFPRMMTVVQVAEYLGVSASKVWRLQKTGIGFPSPVRIGGSTRWDRHAIDQYLNALSTGTEAGVDDVPLP
jgi:excisionase family DNA binding protein